MGVQLIVVIAFIAFVSYDFTHNRKNQRIQQIDSLRREIILRDSLEGMRDQRVIDTIRSDIRRSQNELKDIKLINKKISQQNEKLDRLYNSIHADLPKF